jgi:MYXO-CTERM domain-containing protein
MNIRTSWYAALLYGAMACGAGPAQASLVGHAVTVTVESAGTPVASYATSFQNDGWGYVGGSLAPFYGVNGGLIEQASSGVFFLQVLTDQYGGYRPVSDWHIALDFGDLGGEEIASFQVFRDDFAYADAITSFSAHRMDIRLDGNFGFNSNAYFGFRFSTQAAGTAPASGVPEPDSAALALLALGAAAAARRPLSRSARGSAR